MNAHDSIHTGKAIANGVVFPIPFTSFYQLVLSHIGGKFALAKASSLTALDGFTLSVKDLASSQVDADSTYDAHYIAIGK